MSPHGADPDGDARTAIDSLIAAAARSQAAS
jgi:hypothetical protein